MALAPGGRSQVNIIEPGYFDFIGTPQLLRGDTAWRGGLRCLRHGGGDGKVWASDEFNLPALSLS